MKWTLVVSIMVLSLGRPAFGVSQTISARQVVDRYAHYYHVPAELICAFIDVESNWNPNALSDKGAMGLMQLMPATARRFGAFRPFDTEQNIAAGTRYVTVLMWEFGGDMRLVAAAYYAGDYWVGRKQLGYSNSDVTAYVRAVRQRYLLRKYGAAAPPRR